MNTDLTRFNVNYFNDFGDCVLSIELIDLRYQGFLELCEGVWTMFANHFNYAYSQHPKYPAAPNGNISALRHFFDISGCNLKHSDKLKKDLDEIGATSFLEKYIHISNYVDLLRRGVVAKHKIDNVDFDDDYGYDYEYDVDGIIHNDMLRSYGDIVSLNSKIEKALSCSDASIININILKDDIDSSLFRQDRSLDIHYGKGVAYFNVFEKKANSSLKKEASPLLRISPYKNVELRKIARFLSPEEQQKYYSKYNNNSSKGEPKYSGLIIPLKHDCRVKNMFELVGMINPILLSQGSGCIVSEDGSFYYHDEVGIAVNNIWVDLVEYN